MTEKSLVSVIIPAYNGGAYIAETIRSILAQTHRRFEIIVVDDGSTDNTSAVVAEFAPDVQILRQANQGVCAARNHGFEASTGAFVCFMDQDDHWFPWKLTRQVEAFSRDPELGMVFTSFAVWRNEGGRFSDPTALDPGDSTDPQPDPDYSGWVYHQFLLDCWALTSSTMIRRDAFKSVGGFDLSLPYSEDWDLWLRMARQYRFVKLNRVSTLYRQHADQGNLKLRDIDFRTRLLESAAARWGLASQDGRCLTPARFNQNLARYHMQFGMQHLRFGNRDVTLSSLRRACALHPGHWKYWALLTAVALGWRKRK